MTETSTTAVRLTHFSDIHITAKPLGWRQHDWFDKRLLGWMNYQWLGRKYRFRDADETLACLVRDMRDWQPDRLIFSGDATALGFESEFARAAAILGIADPGGPPGLAVPGNHDYYTKGVAASGLFERFFAPWQTGERVDGAIYPFAQRAGSVWLIAVNTATANRWGWDASGAVDQAQLERLRQLLTQLAPGPRILVTHYPVCLGSGLPERRSHGLRNLDQVVRVAAAGGVCLWLHGHRHGPYHVSCTDLAPFPVICAGSSTQHGYQTYSRYTIRDCRFQAVTRVLVSTEDGFRDGESFELQLDDQAPREAAPGVS
jgi:3',5'-cyclic AMP phosphodiesterase CpdA